MCTLWIYRLMYLVTILVGYLRHTDSTSYKGAFLSNYYAYFIIVLKCLSRLAQSFQWAVFFEVLFPLYLCFLPPITKMYYIHIENKFYKCLSSLVYALKSSLHHAAAAKTAWPIRSLAVRLVFFKELDSRSSESCIWVVLRAVTAA